ncbi:MAG: hypothetical protein ACRBBT_06635 [Paracoccaceae bacterium]
MGTSTLNIRISRAERLVTRLEAALADPNLAPTKREAGEMALAGARKLREHRKAQQMAISVAQGESLHPR